MPSTPFDLVMTEHPSWMKDSSLRRRVLVMPDGARCLVAVEGGNVAYTRLHSDSGLPRVDGFALDGAAAALPDLASALVGLGRVGRLRNVNLWDAVGTAILRQVIRAGQSKKMYLAFCATYGERVPLPGGGAYALFPAPEVVLALSDEQFSALSMAFKRRPLRAAAQAYWEHGAKWLELSPAALVAELQGVPRIGPWTAGAAVADYSNDWSLYPYADLAVRTWATRAAPAYQWPQDEPSFGRVWRALAGDHLSALTLLTLAWGSQHGDIG
jgi:DNA-3-methyladenine glycosylase II